MSEGATVLATAPVTEGAWVANGFGCGGTGASWEARAGLPIGAYRVTATAVDAVGNQRTTPPITFLVNAFPG